MQLSIPFARITTDEYRTQVGQTAAAAAKVAASALPPPSKRTVGRPKRALNTNHILADADAAAAAISPASADNHPAKKQRGKYTNWFSSPYINDILREYRRCGHRPVVAVERLKATAPDDRYVRLSHSSLARWFDKDHKLLPQFQAHLDSGLANVRQNGPAAAFEEAPGVEEEIKTTLLQMRAAGTAINSHVIRWVMQGIISHRLPDTSRLHSLQLGSSFICGWARKNLKWSWRQSTTAASKLPLDWEEQGLQMAMRIAATMEVKKVSKLHLDITDSVLQLLDNESLSSLVADVDVLKHSRHRECLSRTCSCIVVSLFLLAIYDSCSL